MRWGNPVFEVLVLIDVVQTGRQTHTDTTIHGCGGGVGARGSRGGTGT